MIIESPNTNINQPIQTVIDFVSVPENYKQLMPENISKFELTGNQSFKFALQGMPEFELKIVDIQAHKILLTSANEKTPFQLSLLLNSITENNTSAQFVFEGNFNAMMAMMIKNPISNFLGVLSQKLGSL
jgi:hypothetical protein